MSLHNYIRQTIIWDRIFEEFETNSDFVVENDSKDFEENKLIVEYAIHSTDVDMLCHHITLS